MVHTLSVKTHSSALLVVLVVIVSLALSATAGVSAVAAQTPASSVIQGRVVDETGGVLPGVTATLTSPALLGGDRVTITQADGSYRFGDLPAGTYSLVFQLAGFTTLVRDNLRLGIAFTARVDTTMGLGEIEESVTVTGAAPVVDMSSSTVAANFVSETIDTIPRGRDLNMVVDMAPGVARPGAYDVGGSGMGGRRATGAFGDPAPQPKLEVEGVNITSGGASVSSVYFNYFGFDEEQYQTSGTDAEMGTPGIHMVSVLKSGGNEFHGRYEGSYEGSGLQANNLNSSLIAQGLSDTQPIKYAWDAAGDLGGRILRDKLWFYGGYNTQNRKVGLLGFASGPGPDGEYLTGDEPLADYDNTIRGANVKLSWQLSTNNRLVGVYMRANKIQPMEQAGRFRPLEATRDYYNVSEVRKGEFQSTLNDRTLINGLIGYGGFVGDYSVPRSKWYPGTPSKYDRNTGLYTGSGSSSDQRPRYNVQYNAKNQKARNHGLFGSIRPRRAR
jgi:hypothetical protein